jgi:hypothetical protein
MSLRAKELPRQRHRRPVQTICPEGIPVGTVTMR